MSVCTSSSVAAGDSPASRRAATASSPRSISLHSSSVSTFAWYNAIAQAFDSWMSNGQRRKSMPIELLSASNSGAGPPENRPPHSL